MHSLKSSKTGKTGQSTTSTRELPPIAPSPLHPHTSPGSSPSRLSSRVPNADPIRKMSSLPKKQLTQSSSRFRQQKLPIDYKALPLMKGNSDAYWHTYMIAYYLNVWGSAFTVGVLQHVLDIQYYSNIWSKCIYTHIYSICIYICVCVCLMHLDEECYTNNVCTRTSFPKLVFSFSQERRTTSLQWTKQLAPICLSGQLIIEIDHSQKMKCTCTCTCM